MNVNIRVYARHTPGGTMTRYTDKRPGFRCPQDHPQCVGKHPGQQHGRHDDEWLYTVSDGEVALTLTVYSNEYRGEPYPGNEERKIRGADLSAHVGWPTEAEAIRNGFEGQKCEYLTGGRCWSDFSSGLQAGEFFDNCGEPTFEQPERFWLALESRLVSVATAARAERPTCVRCAHCDGTGVVEPRP